MDTPQPTNGNGKTSWMNVTNHSKVSASVFAGAVTSFVLAILKSKLGIDLAGQEANLTMIVMAVVGYVVPNAE